MASSNTKFHSCSYCQHLSIDIGHGQNHPHLLLDDVIAAAGDGCGFFKRRLDLLKQQMPQDEEYTYEDFDSLEMEMGIDLNDGKPVVSCNWVMQSNGYQPDIIDQLLAYSDDSALEKFRTRPPGQYSFSEKEVRWMRERLDTCTQTHHICKKARAKAKLFEKPKFLIDIGSKDNSDARLIKSSTSQGIKYAILSYCWGKGSSKTYETTSDNLQARLRSLALHEMPQTIKDAVTVTRALGIRYLWVDAICIEQNLSRSEKREILRNMPEIYAGAAIVIGAGSASHCNEGFLGRRNLQYHAYELQVSRTDGLVITKNKVHLLERGFEVKSDPLYTRVWTYQEGEAALFSLAFDTEQLVWKCQESRHADSDIGLLSDPYEGNETITFFDLFMASKEEVCSSDLNMCTSKYIEMCADYSRRQCGTLDDKLVAFSWAIDLMAKATRWDISECKAALWERDMPRQLLFCRRAADGPSIKFGTETWNTREETMIPSWSWASKRTPVKWKDRNSLDHEKDYTVEYVSCDIVPADVSDPLGAIKGKHLTLRGHVHTALWDGLKFTTHDLSQAGRRLAPRRRSQSPTTKSADKSQREEGVDTRGKPNLATFSYRRRDSPFSKLPVDVTWDCPSKPARQRVMLLELRCTCIESNYKSYGIILTCNGRDPSERLATLNLETLQVSIGLKSGKRGLLELYEKVSVFQSI